MSWYCVQTKPGKESRVEQFLRGELELETYFPRLRRMKTIRRVRKMVTEPLFPRYLFCNLDAATNYRAVRYGQDVIGIVSAGDRPTIVSEETIAQLKSWAGEDEDIITIEPGKPKSGDKVKITDGPMQGLQAIFLEETKDSDRVAILLNLMNSEARATIGRAHIEPINN